MMKKITMQLATVACVLVALGASTAHAVPATMPIQGTLTRPNGNTVNGAQVVRFRLYDVSEGGTPIHDETQTLMVENGAFTAYLGSETPLSFATFAKTGIWLGITIDTDVEMTPRFALGSVPYAAMSDDSALFAGMPPTAFATSAHDHAGQYLPQGSALACTGTQKMAGIGADGNVACAEDVDTTYAAAAGAGLALSGTAFSLATGGVGSTHLASGAVTTDKIGNDQVTSLKIAANAVTTAKIGDNQVTNAKLASSAVTTAKIGDNQVTSAKLQNIFPGSVTQYSIDVGVRDVPTAQADLCTLSQVSLTGNGGSCTVHVAGNNWQLHAVALGGGNCVMTCYKW